MRASTSSLLLKAVVEVDRRCRHHSGPSYGGPRAGASDGLLSTSDRGDRPELDQVNGAGEEQAVALREGLALFTSNWDASRITPKEVTPSQSATRAEFKFLDAQVPRNMTIRRWVSAPSQATSDLRVRRWDPRRWSRLETKGHPRDGKFSSVVSLLRSKEELPSSSTVIRPSTR